MVEQPLEQSESLPPMQSGIKDAPVTQCFLKRDKTTSTYYLYLGLGQANEGDGKFLLAARRTRRLCGVDYVISLDMNDFSKESNNYVGMLRSNLGNTKSTLHDVAARNKSGSRRISSKQVFPNYSNVTFVQYARNLLGKEGPRRMRCTFHSIPASAMATKHQAEVEQNKQKLEAAVDLRTNEGGVGGGFTGENMMPLVLENKVPRWHDHLKCWCLNFRGRVTVSSVKNFQLLNASDCDSFPNVVLQFGKTGKDAFTMDFRHPLSVFQAFAICLTSFGNQYHVPTLCPQ